MGIAAGALQHLRPLRVTWNSGNTRSAIGALATTRQLPPFSRRCRANTGWTPGAREISGSGFYQTENELALQRRGTDRSRTKQREPERRKLWTARLDGAQSAPSENSARKSTYLADSCATAEGCGRVQVKGSPDLLLEHHSAVDDSGQDAPDPNHARRRRALDGNVAAEAAEHDLCH